MGNFGSEIIRPIIRALDDAPVHLRPLVERVGGLGKKQGQNRSGVNSVDRYVATQRGANVNVTRVDRNTGRPVSQSGTIRQDHGGSRRGDNATVIGRQGGDGYDGGHLGGHRFFGDTPDEGIVAQASNLNRGAWKKMENEWADWANSGKVVDYDIEVSYPPNSTVPDGFMVNYRVTDADTGQVVYRNAPIFANTSGQNFNRVYSSEMR